MKMDQFSFERGFVGSMPEFSYEALPFPVEADDRDRLVAQTLRFRGPELAALSAAATSLFPTGVATLAKIGLDDTTASLPNAFYPELESPARPNLYAHLILAAHIGRVLQDAATAAHADVATGEDLSAAATLCLLHDGWKRRGLMRAEAKAAGYVVSGIDDDETRMRAYPELSRTEMETLARAEGAAETISLIKKVIDVSDPLRPMLRAGNLVRKIVHLSDVLSASALPEEEVWSGIVHPRDKIVIAKWQQQYDPTHSSMIVATPDGPEIVNLDRGGVFPDAVPLTSALNFQLQLDMALCEELCELIGLERVDGQDTADSLISFIRNKLPPLWQ